MWKGGYRVFCDSEAVDVLDRECEYHILYTRPPVHIIRRGLSNNLSPERLEKGAAADS